MLPDSIKARLENKLNLTVLHVNAVSGGSINRAVKVDTDRGSFFLKWNSEVPADFFDKEAQGLTLLREAETRVRVPEVILSEPPAGKRPGFLLIEYVEEGRDGDAFEFGIQLAELHMNSADEFGLHTGNYIGSLPQSNRSHPEWADFFTEERLAPQLKMAIDSGKLEARLFKNMERLSSRLDELLPFTAPSLLHGDLWSGNFLYDISGRAVLIDPAVYYGHPEADLAFTKMFGGFPDSFYSGYDSVSPVEPGFLERVPVYNLYPLLVHLNLFGGHYTAGAKSTLEQF